MNRYPIQGTSVNFGIFSDIGRKALLSVASNLQETGVALQNLGARRKKAAMQTVMSPVYRGAARIALGKEGFQKHREHKAKQAFLRGHNANLDVLKQNILEKVGDDKPTAHQKKRLEQIADFFSVTIDTFFIREGGVELSSTDSKNGLKSASAYVLQQEVKARDEVIKFKDQMLREKDERIKLLEELLAVYRKPITGAN